MAPGQPGVPKGAGLRGGRAPGLRVLVPLAILLAAALGGGLAYLESRPRPSAEPVSPGTAGAADPDQDIHIRLEEPARRMRLQALLARLTTAPASELGHLRDDIALLAADESGRRQILEAYRQRAHVTHFEAAAFADLFARIRDPLFVDPVRELLGHDELTVRQAAVDAARCQADPELQPAILEAYRRLEREEPGRGTWSRLLILQAAFVCGGPGFVLLLDEALRDPVDEMRVQAAAKIAVSGLRSFIPALLRRHAEAATAAERMAHAHALACLGERTHVAGIREELRSADRTRALKAVQLLVDLGDRESLPTLVELHAGAGQDLRPHFAWARVQLRDEAFITSCREEARDRNRPLPERLAALRALASGPPDEARVLLELADAGLPGGPAAIVQGLVEAEAAPPAELLLALWNSPELPDASGLLRLLAVAGDGVLPGLLALWDGGRARRADADFAAAVGAVGTPAARAALIERRPRNPGAVAAHLRLLDLRRARGG